MAQYGGEKPNSRASGAGGSAPDRNAINEGQIRTRRGPMDVPFLLLVLIILTIGVITVLSASFARAYYKHDEPTRFFIRQLFFAVTGVGIMVVLSRFHVSFFRRNSMLLLLIAIGLLALVPIIGKTFNGAKRWIGIGDLFTVQPSEIAKIAVIMSFSYMICMFKDRMKTFKYGVLPFGVIILFVVGLLLLEPHLSASVIIIAIGAIMMFAGGTAWKWFIAGGIGVGAAGYLIVTKMAYASSRITSWRDPFSDPTDSGWQIIQSLYSIGSGGLLGLGIGQSRQKYLYLPEEYNDFIFSVFCEEMGYVGAILLLVLFALLIIRGYWLALHARDRYGALVITGITSLIAIQVFLNVAVVTNLVPNTGISLPFFSYGGTALWIQLAEMGIVLSISRDIPLKRGDKEETEDE